MGDVKPWQWIVMVAAVGVLAISVYLTFGRGKVDMGDRVYMVDVVTGELFVADTGGRRGVVIPAKNPATGERTVVPVMTEEDGGISVSERYRGLAESILDERGVDPAPTIDASTWSIAADADSAKAYRYP